MADFLSYSNFGKTVLSASLPSDERTLSVGDASVFPDSDFSAVIWGAAYASPLDDAERELVYVSVSESVLTASRAMENTQAKDWPQGSSIANVITAATLNSLVAADYQASSFKQISAAYAMSESDVLLFCSFNPEGTAYQVTLPDASSCGGRRYTLVNTSKIIGSTVKVAPANGQSFARLTGSYLSLCSCASCVLVSDGSAWNLITYDSAGPADRKNMTTGGALLFGEGVVFADASSGYLAVVLWADGCVQGLPVTIIRSDSTDGTLMIQTDSGQESLGSQWDSITFTTDGTGMKVISRVVSETSSSSSVSTVESVTHSGQIDETAEYVFADASAGLIALYSQWATDNEGKVFTVIKTDSGANPVYIFLQGGSGTVQVNLTAQSSAQFVSDGTDWRRVF